MPPALRSKRRQFLSRSRAAYSGALSDPRWRNERRIVRRAPVFRLVSVAGRRLRAGHAGAEPPRHPPAVRRRPQGSGPAPGNDQCVSPAFDRGRAFGHALGTRIMNLMMTSTPLAMRAHDHHFNDAAFVPRVAHYRHVRTVVLHRLADRPSRRAARDSRRDRAAFLAIAAALAGTGLPYFWTSLFLLGVGWNFMYVGGSALLSDSSSADPA